MQMKVKELKGFGKGRRGRKRQRQATVLEELGEGVFYTRTHHV